MLQELSVITSIAPLYHYLTPTTYTYTYRWSMLVYSSIADDTLFDGGMTSNPVRWPRSDPAPVLLYLLHLLAFFFIFVAMSIVLDMW